MTFSLNSLFEGVSLKRELENICASGKENRKKLCREEQDSVVALVALRQPLILQTLNSCIKFEIQNIRPKNCQIGGKTYEIKYSHLISAHPFEGLVIHGYECRKHDVRTLHLGNFKDHIRIKDQCKEKSIPTEYVKRIIYKDNGWWVCPDDTPLTSKESILNAYFNAHCNEK